MRALFLLLGGLLLSKAAAADPYTAAIGVRGSGLSVEGSPSAAGVGVAARVRLSERWGAEGAADLLQDGEQVSQVPLSLSVARYFAPRLPVSLYGLGGVGMSYSLDAQALDSSRLFGHLGVGAELRLQRLMVAGDLRYLVLDHTAGDPIEQGLVANAAEGGQLNVMLGYTF